MKNQPKKNSEREEALMRVLVWIISGIILYLWGYISFALIVINWLIALFSGTRNQVIAEFVENWNSALYCFFRYLSGASNERPFPFGKLKVLGKFEK